MTHYSHKRFLISVDRVDEDGVLITQSGNIPYKSGSIIAHDQLGNSFILSDEDFYTNYAPVRKMRKTKTKRKSPFEALQGYIEMGELVKQSNKNNDNYIFGVKE